VTVLETIRKGTAFLGARGVESPRLQVEWILAKVLELPRLRLYLEFERVLTPAQTGRARELIQRRGRREPLQHILGTTVFRGLELGIGPGALIPRPETELLAEKAGTILQGMRDMEPVVLDFGTGSGCLIIALAVGYPAAVCHAVDISAEALVQARENASRHRVEGRVTFHLGDGFTVLPVGLRFDLLVSNPPYIPTEEIASLDPEVRDYDPRVALDGGADGLEFYRRLAGEGARWVRPGGWLLVELGDGQASGVAGVLREHNWVVDQPEADYSNRSRFLKAQPPRS
jgi:release factor glutamine methyltransferase